MKKQYKIWVLVDNRIGNANQAISLAEKLCGDFEIKNIEYNFFAKLPNFMLAAFPMHVKKPTLDQLKAEELPDLIISSGRRTATLALYLKKLKADEVKIVQIMRPNILSNKFDLIILPQHDKYNYKLSNVIRIVGALNNVQDRIQKTYPSFKTSYPNINKYAAIAIGGSTKNYKFTLQDAKSLANALLAISENQSLQLIISFSRRTPKIVKKYFHTNFAWPNIIYDPYDKDSSVNPYPAMLKKAEYIIITPDSISMCSEAAGTGVPLYIFAPEKFDLHKHNFFIQQLVDLGIARRIQNDTNYLEKYDYQPLCEAGKIANFIENEII